MTTRRALTGLLGGTVWGIPGLLLLALLSPSPQLTVLLIGLLLLAAGGQLLPYLLVPEAARSVRLAAQEKWAQANYFNILAQQKLQRSPWKGGWQVFRTAYQPATLLMALRSDSGRLLLGLGQHREAERVLRQALKSFAGDAPAWHNLALALYCQGKHRQARAALESAVELGFIPPAPEILLRWPLARLGRSTTLRHGDSRVSFYQNLGFHRIALACLSVSQQTDTCWRRTVSYLALERRECARRELLGELGRSATNPYAWLGLGFLAALESRRPEALAFYRKALQLDPTNVAAKEQLYLLLARTGDRRELLSALALLEEHEPDPQHLALGKAYLCAGLGRWAPALRQVLIVGAGLRSLSLLELVAYGNLKLGQQQAGCRLLHRFCSLLEVSGTPLLARADRLKQARETLRSFRAESQRAARTDSRHSQTS